MALYLCKMDPERTDPRTKDAAFVALIGAIVEVRDWQRGVIGYQFVPHVSSRQRSRRIWPDANSCIPKWTERHGFLRLLDAQEYERARHTA